MAKRELSQSKAKWLALFLTVMALTLGIGRTFFDQDLSGALVGLSTAPLFYWCYRNPHVMVSKTFDEFCRNYDKARDMKFLYGFPLYYLVLALAALYITGT